MRFKLTGAIKKLKRSFPIDECLGGVQEPRRCAFLNVRGVLWLMLLFFTFRREYSLVAMDEWTRGLKLSDLCALFRLLQPAGLTDDNVRRLRKKNAAGEPLICDSHVSDILRRIEPEELRSVLRTMTMKMRRNKTWKPGDPNIIVVDGTEEGKCSERRCPNCRENSGKYSHFGVYLTQLTHEPHCTMGYRPVPDGKGELTVAKQLCRDQFKRCRGRYGDIVLADPLYLDAEFFNMHRKYGMHVVVRGQEQDGKPLRNMKIFHHAAQLFEHQDSPDDTLVDSKRGRRIQIWEAEDLDDWEGLKEPVRVLRFEVTDLKSDSTQVHWAVTTIPKQDGTGRRIWRLTVKRWGIENNVFRQQKTFEGLDAKHVHGPEGKARENFMILYLLAMNIVGWLRYRHLVSPRRRSRDPTTRYSENQFRLDLLVSWEFYLARCADRLVPPWVLCPP